MWGEIPLKASQPSKAGQPYSYEHDSLLAWATPFPENIAYILLVHDHAKLRSLVTNYDIVTRAIELILPSF